MEVLKQLVVLLHPMVVRVVAVRVLLVDQV
jgi:hypothetical protein